MRRAANSSILSFLHFTDRKSISQDYKLSASVDIFLLQTSISFDSLVCPIPFLEKISLGWKLITSSEVKVAQLRPTLCNPMDYTVH